MSSGRWTDLETAILIEAMGKSLENLTWESIVTEMKQRAPDVLDFLVAIAVPQNKQSGEQHVPPLYTAYGILMNSRWKELSLIQKTNGILLGFRNATKRIYLAEH
ncbi:hypothetical protein ACROYT_G015086 [Oculina patagonica]